MATGDLAGAMLAARTRMPFTAEVFGDPRLPFVHRCAGTCFIGVVSAPAAEAPGSTFAMPPFLIVQVSGEGG